MKKFILHETEEEIFERKDIKSTALFAFRAGLISVPFVIATYFLIEHWGGRFPKLIWTTPIVLPLTFTITAFIESICKKKLIFTHKYLKEESMGSKKVSWKSVKTWKVYNDDSKPKWPISYDPRRAKWLILEFNLTFNRKVYFRLHESHGIDKVKELVVKFGKI